VIEKVFLVDLLTRKFPNAILFSLARTIPPLKVIPTAVAPGMYIDIFEMIPEHNKGLSPFRYKKVDKIFYTIKNRMPY
jgi:hypothetical protein